MSKTSIAIVGCGSISSAYFGNCRRFPNLEIVACTDRDLSRAKLASEKYGVPFLPGVKELLASPEVEIVVNLTIPQAHAAVDCEALRAGKHVFSEKPLGLTLAEGREIVETAARCGRRLGCAPDTVLGAAVQTCRKFLDDGGIGAPLAFTAVMQCGGHESWHPAPEFYYQAGGGPMFDMGPYYLHALVTLLGPVARVSGLTKRSFPERIIQSGPRSGARIPVDVPTHVTSLLEFRNGVIGTLVMSFDVRAAFTNPVIEIFGSEGTLKVPDPNGTNGTVQVAKAGGDGWETVALTHGYAEGARGLGVADMAAAIRSGRDHRANERIALHVLEIMEAVHVSADQGRHVDLSTTCERPEPMRQDLPEFVLE
ncbi:MAG TPA: Gfo/Idh/MocA family oxidoreductase [Terrimicrobiaceae bacterium]|nr:Gfo/Idh/MocA family oxidoreductase [Terrimicrobiaceae bacterium]